VAAYCAAFPDKRVVIVSESNAAIDEDLERLIRVERMKPGQLVRIGMARKPMGGRVEVPPERRGYYLKCAMEDFRAKQRVLGMPKRMLNEQRISRERELITQSQVVVMTLSQVGKVKYADLEFHLVVNDEGAQTLESSLIQALEWRVETTVIVGDSFQLLP
jgi:hypothetical protein